MYVIPCVQVKVNLCNVDSLQKLNEEALAHASLKYNMELSSLRTESTKLASDVEREKAARDKLELEVSFNFIG